MDNKRQIELLAPARNAETAYAALDFGADAVYMGGPRFGARYGATNDIDDLACVADYAHGFGAKLYVALNTLLYDKELTQAGRIAREVISAGADALIVQDMAYLEMGLAGIPIHASTQAFNAAPEKVAFLEKAGISRVILERNLTLEQIKDIRAATGVQLECFVHGAICVCHSGRCYMSRTMSDRSGNRGNCSQPCRLTYDLVNGAGDMVLKSKYLLSVMDLDLSHRIGDLMDAGVDSFKIEGRLKDIAYVKNIVSLYRRIIDQQINCRPDTERLSSGISEIDFVPDPRKTFSRGGTEYFLDGVRKGVASFHTPKSLGEPLGKVRSFSAGWIDLGSAAGLRAGDGICFIGEGGLQGMYVEKTEGSRIFTGKDKEVAPGAEIFRNYDHKYVTALRKASAKRKIAVTAAVKASVDEFSVRFTDDDGITAERIIYGPFEAAGNRERMLEVITAQMSKSGDTIFRVDSVHISGVDPPFLTASALNSLRREGLDELLEERKKVHRGPIRSEESLSAGSIAGTDAGDSGEIGTAGDSSYDALSARPDSNESSSPIEGFPFIHSELDGTENVTNSLATGFYRKHGVENIEEGYDLRSDMAGMRVMRTPYCIRREIGECLKEGSRLAGPLYLERGRNRYELHFDCIGCYMDIIYVGTGS